MSLSVCIYMTCLSFFIFSCISLSVLSLVSCACSCVMFLSYVSCSCAFVYVMFICLSCSYICLRMYHAHVSMCLFLCFSCSCIYVCQVHVAVYMSYMCVSCICLCVKCLPTCVCVFLCACIYTHNSVAMMADQIILRILLQYTIMGDCSIYIWYISLPMGHNKPLSDMTIKAVM